MAEPGVDTASLGRILADDFVAVGPRGFMLSKEQWLSSHDSGSPKYESFGWGEVAARVHGNAAVVTGRQTVKARYEAGQVRREIRDQFRAASVFVEERGRWLMPGVHLLRLIPGRAMDEPRTAAIKKPEARNRMEAARLAERVRRLKPGL